MDRTKDMTVGKPGRLILLFALPLMVGNVFQQMYTMVDTIIVGRGVGVEALAALGASDWLNWMVLGIVTGFTQGFSILTAQRFGAEDGQGLRKSVAMSAMLSAGMAVAILIVSQLTARPLLRFLNTPANIVDDSLLYLRIIFAGIPVITAYNVLASVLRALGNSRTPLLAMVVAAFINVVLDLVFVLVFHWGVAGAAIATVAAQFFSCLFCLKAIRSLPILEMSREDWRPSKPVIKELIRLGTPMAFQNGLIAVGGLVVQYVINGFGFIFVAGFTATNKLYGVLELAATSFGFSMATYAGQNLGAGKLERIRSGMRSAVGMAVGTAVVIGAAVILFGRSIVGLFISGTPEEVAQVVEVAYTYLAIMGAMLIVLYLLHVYRSALQGMGDTIVPMISGIIEMIMRISIILILPALIGEFGVYFAEVAAWLGAAVLLMCMYYVRIRRLEREMKCQGENQRGDSC